MGGEDVLSAKNLGRTDIDVMSLPGKDGYYRQHLDEEANLVLARRRFGICIVRVQTLCEVKILAKTGEYLVEQFEGGATQS